VRLGGDATVSNASAVSVLQAAVGAIAAGSAPTHGKRQGRHLTAGVTNRVTAGVTNRALVFGELLAEQGWIVASEARTL
jgi:hypothetical protein